MPDDAIRRDHGFHPLRVKRIVQETADTRSLVLDVPEALRATFAYRPGQFCTFRIPVGDDPPLRCYSMSSAPETDEDLTVTVKRVPGGVGSNWLHDALAEGDTVEVTKPAGVFCVSDPVRPIVAFCGGSGITPVMAIIRSVLATPSPSVRLLYANRDEGSIIFGDVLAALQQERPDHLQVRHHLDAESGYLDRAAVAEFIGADLDADVFICGPGPFMDLVEHTLLDLGVAPDRIAIERFANDAVLGGAAGEPADAPAEDGTITLVIRGRSTTMDHQRGDTVLSTARRSGVTTPYSCEAGNCATCMALLRDGSVSLRANNALTAAELEEGWILTCQAEPTTPSVTIEFEDL